MMQTYGTAIKRLCYTYLQDDALSDDAAQDCFIKAYRKLDSLRGAYEKSEIAWLMKIAMNVCRDYRRSKWFRYVDRYVTPEDISQQSYEEDMDVLLISDAVFALPEKLRTVVFLHYYQELTYDEITQVLRISRSSVYSQLEKARIILRQSVEGVNT